MTATEREYVTAYRDIVLAVNDATRFGRAGTRFVTTSMRQLADSLEARIVDPERLEALRERARREAWAS